MAAAITGDDSEAGAAVYTCTRVAKGVPVKHIKAARLQVYPLRCRLDLGLI